MSPGNTGLGLADQPVSGQGVEDVLELDIVLLGLNASIRIDILDGGHVHLGLEAPLKDKVLSLEREVVLGNVQRV